MFENQDCCNNHHFMDNLTDSDGPAVSAKTTAADSNGDGSSKPLYDNVYLHKAITRNQNIERLKNKVKISQLENIR
jgi:hypothetical protein